MGLILTSCPDTAHQHLFPVLQDIIYSATTGLDILDSTRGPTVTCNAHVDQPVRISGPI